MAGVPLPPMFDDHALWMYDFALRECLRGGDANLFIDSIWFLKRPTIVSCLSPVIIFFFAKLADVCAWIVELPSVEETNDCCFVEFNWTAALEVLNSGFSYESL